MTKSISILSNSIVSSDKTYTDSVNAQPTLSGVKIGQLSGSRRVRARTVYCLLVTSIAFTVLGAIATAIELTYADNPINTILHEQGLLPQDGYGLKVVRFSSFVILGITCSLAFATLLKRDKIKARLLALVRDTNRQLEEQVQNRTNELASALKAKDHFLGIATHDLKAPLNGILGLLRLIKRERNNISEQESEYFSHIENSCLKMKNLIQDILEVNRIEQGKAVVNKEPVDIARLMNELSVNFAQVAASKNIQFVIEAIDAKIETDPVSLTRILENLVSNAIKFSPFNKKVWLKVNSENDRIRFEVIDQGPGIPVEDKPRLFTKFQRLSNRPTNAESSTGLGLAIVKELTVQLGGQITLYSAIGKGSTFIVSLPSV